MWPGLLAVCIKSALCLTIIPFVTQCSSFPSLGSLFLLSTLRNSTCHQLLRLHCSSAPGTQSRVLSHPLPLTAALKAFRRTVVFHCQPSHLTQFLLHQGDRSEHTWGSYRSCQHMPLLFSFLLLERVLLVSLSLSAEGLISLP